MHIRLSLELSGGMICEGIGNTDIQCTCSLTCMLVFISLKRGKCLVLKLTGGGGPNPPPAPPPPPKYMLAVLTRQGILTARGRDLSLIIHPLPRIQGWSRIYYNYVHYTTLPWFIWDSIVWSLEHFQKLVAHVADATTHRTTTHQLGV